MGFGIFQINQQLDYPEKCCMNFQYNSINGTRMGINNWTCKKRKKKKMNDTSNGCAYVKSSSILRTNELIDDLIHRTALQQHSLFFSPPI